MTASSCVGSRSQSVLNDKKFGAIVKLATVSAEPAADLPKNLEPTRLASEHGFIRREINVSGGQLLVGLVVGSCFVGPLVWWFVRYWLFAP